MNIQAEFVFDFVLILKSPTDHILFLHFQQFIFHFANLLLSPVVLFQLSPTLFSHFLFCELKNLLDFIHVLKFDFDAEWVTAIVWSEKCFDDRRFCVPESIDHCFIADALECFKRI